MFFLLRKWDLKDAPSVSLFANNRLIADNLKDGFPHPYTTRDAAQYISLCLQNGEQKQLTRAIDVGGRAVGSIGVFLQENVYRKSAELGYWLGEPYWGKGIMSSAISQICEITFSYYDVVRIFALPFSGNKGSCRALEKAGFHLEGTLKNSVFKNGKIMDSCIYAKLK